MIELNHILAEAYSVNEKDFPINLKYERDKEIGRAQRKAKKVKVSNYVKTMLVPGVILATITFFNVGPWYDRNYGFDGSASAAFSAAICVIIGCAFLA